MNVVEKVDDRVKINRILVSVSDKTGLDDFIPGMLDINPDLKIYSTGGTYQKISEILGDRSKGCLIRVSDYTGQPETQGGLVKTLDFKIYLGLLTETYNESHQSDLRRTDGVPIDMAVVNLYPFKKTIEQNGVTVEVARSNIDIGGPTMVRASAKNYLRVASVVNPLDYKEILSEMKSQKGMLSLSYRFKLARKAFEHTATYDRTIASYLLERNPDEMASCYTF